MNRRRLYRHFVASVSLVCSLGLAAAAPVQNPGPAAVQEIRAAAARLPRLHSLVVSRDGDISVEYYARNAGPSRTTNVKSVSKSVISTLVGIAIERGMLKDVRQPIGPFFPQLARDADSRKARITIEDLVTMRSGLVSTSFGNYGAWVGSRNWIDYVLTRPLENEPGATMEYSTGNTHLLSAILTQATKRSTWAFAQEALAKPMGFALGQWPRDPQGIYFGGNDMLMTPRQMLALGELYLNRGRRGDRQIVPAAWVDAACVPRGRSRFNPDQTYGYGWWMRDFAGHAGCFAWGYGGQYIIVFRDLRLVVVTTSSTAVSDERREHRREIFDLIERLILPAATAR
jgi:CubicO group peptidase (beta-lactamase class C family)